ncbi:hypothetical protein AGMMS49587_17560 [Spirochaetia bacterium]|nr:hypothetical protein AGMMS49587_17560 [Spirochaetia bacterium]
MGLFTAGNLITLGIVALALIMFWRLDRTNKKISNVRKYADKLKEDLSAFAEQKAVDVKNYALDLDVEQKAARELMKHLQITDQELAEKAAAVAQIDERINAYDKSLEELVKMTARVQENMGRIREESSFVENTGKQVNETKNRLAALEKDLGEIELRFERENGVALEETSEALIAAVKSTLSDLEVHAETIERQVEDHREAVNRIEEARAANLERDMALVDKTLREVVEKAGLRADKMEDAALVKLRDQAQERVKRLQTAVEEKLKSIQDNAKTRITEMQEQLKAHRDEWKNETSEIEAKQKAYQDEWKKDIQELNALARSQRESWTGIDTELDAVFAAQQEKWAETAAELEASVQVHKESLAAALAGQQEKWAQTAAELDAAAQAQRQSLDAALSAQQEKWAAASEELDAAAAAQRQSLDTALSTQQEKWAAASEELEAAVQAQRQSLDAALTGQRESLTGVVAELEAAAAVERQSLEAAAKQQRASWAEAAAALETAASTQREKWNAAIAGAEQQVLESAGARLEEYKAAQSEEFRQLEALAGDTAQLEGELRRIMAEAEKRVRSDFTHFEEESADSREAVASQFNTQVTALKTEIDGVEQELNSLKNRAYDNVSEKLKGFEDDFFADLSKRSGDIDRRLAEWQESVEARLAEIAAAGETGRQEMELAFNEELRKNLADQSERLIAELEHLKAETGAFEAQIREEMQSADETRSAFRTQLDRDLEEVRETAEATVKVEIGRYALSSAETLKQNQRELEEQLREIADTVEKRSGETAGILDSYRKNIDESVERIAQVRASIEKVREEAGTYRQEIFSRTGEEAKTLEAAVAEAERHIREFTAQTKLFDKTDELRTELERRIEDLRGDIDRLDQRKSEAAQMEGEFVRIKRLGDDVNDKMNKFLREQHRIEVMEADFNRLLQTSQSVEEKLVQVSSSDDTLQAVQIQIRRLEDALKETEERYQRLERKNQALQATTDGIDRNFKALQESEQDVRRVREDLDRMSGELEGIRLSVETLAAGSERAEAAAEKLSSLDATLVGIEKRIKDMNVAREWLANTETRLNELNKQTQNQVKLAASLNKDEGGKGVTPNKGAPSPGVRENIITLARQGWTAKEIANSLKCSIGEVELILELNPRD